MAHRNDLSNLPTREPPAPVSGAAFVYILACSDDALYVGSAGDVAKRLTEHGGPRAQSLLAIIQVLASSMLKDLSRLRWLCNVSASSNAGAEPRNWP
jgi:predicted GIY-YIG superfamily endonuclease